MTYDAALADALAIESLDLTGTAGEGLDALGLPAVVVERCRHFGGTQLRTALVARREGRAVGLALTVRRPLTAYVKLAELWVESALADADAVEDALLAAVEDFARDAGAVVVKRALAPDDQRGWDRGLARGYQPMPEPAGAGPALHEAADTPRGLAKWLSSAPQREAAPAYWRQTTDFTCGPVSVGMALSLLAGEAPTRATEIGLWREATTIVAPAGPGGCDTFGLGLAAERRGLAARVHISREGPILLERAKTEQSRDIMRFAQLAFRAEAKESGLAVTYGSFSLAELQAVVAEGAVALLLIDQDVMHAESCPHWILVHGFHDGVFLAHDPWTDTHLGESWVDGQDLPLPPDTVDRLAHYGDPDVRSMLVLSRPTKE